MRKSLVVAFIFLSLFLVVFSAQKINLTTADIGRHIKNGEIMLNADEYGLSRGALLHTNFFSYTEPDFSFVNHHWASGVLFYLIFSAFGWMGLSLFNLLLFILAFALLFLLAQRKLPLLFFIPYSLFLIPLIADRAEIRPETISYFFIALFIYILTRFAENDLNKKFLYILPIVTLFWANLHIYFVFGLFIIGAFLLEKVIRRDWSSSKLLLFVLGLSAFASCITPFGPKALLYPFTIFKNYGYRLVENQSIFFLKNINFSQPSFIWWKLAAILGVILTVWALWRRARQFPIALGLIALVFGILSFSAIRNFSIFGLVLLPYFAYLLGAMGIGGEKTSRTATAGELGSSSVEETSVFFRPNSDGDLHLAGSVVVSILLLIIIPIRFSTNMPWNPSWGLGLLPNINASADFVKENKIAGPFFNNYDIGGYFIFNMFPKEKPFVDNRPEAYSTKFFQETYIPMQEKSDVWNQKSTEYNLNAVWFYRHDLTPWAQQFLITRVQDLEWAPVFVDDYTIIFLKRNTKNSELIQKFELPKEIFSVS